MDTKNEISVFPGFENERLQNQFDFVNVRKKELDTAYTNLTKAMEQIVEGLISKTKDFDLTEEQQNFLDLPAATVFGGEKTGYTLLGETLRRSLYDSLNNNEPRARSSWVIAGEDNFIYSLNRMELRSFVENLHERLSPHGFYFSSLRKDKDGLMRLHTSYDYTKQHAWLK